MSIVGDEELRCIPLRVTGLGPSSHIVFILVDGEGKLHVDSCPYLAILDRWNFHLRDIFFSGRFAEQTVTFS